MRTMMMTTMMMIMTMMRIPKSWNSHTAVTNTWHNKCSLKMIYNIAPFASITDEVLRTSINSHLDIHRCSIGTDESQLGNFALTLSHAFTGQWVLCHDFLAFMGYLCWRDVTYFCLSLFMSLHRAIAFQISDGITQSSWCQPIRPTSGHRSKLRLFASRTN